MTPYDQRVSWLTSLVSGASWLVSVSLWAEDASPCASGISGLIFFVILDYCYCLRTIPSLRKLEYSNDWSLSIDHHWSYRIFMLLWVWLWFHRRPTRTSSSHFSNASSIQCMTSVFAHLYPATVSRYNTLLNGLICFFPQSAPDSRLTWYLAILLAINLESWVLLLTAKHFNVRKFRSPFSLMYAVCHNGPCWPCRLINWLW